MTAILKVDTIQDTAGNNIINESSDTITIGASGDTTNIIGTLQNNGSALSLNPITMADQFRLTADLVGTNDVISSNLERVDDESFAKIGTGMSVSSGIFSFPSTGFYQIITKASGYVPGGTQDNFYIQTSVTINNSSYDRIGRVGGSANNSYEQNSAEACFVNVTNISNVKVKFESVSLDTNTGLQGDTSFNQTSFTFIRLGDSQ